MSCNKHQICRESQHTTSSSPILMASHTPMQVDPFGMTAFTPLPRTTNSSFPPTTPLERLYQNVDPNCVSSNPFVPKFKGPATLPQCSTSQPSSPNLLSFSTFPHFSSNRFVPPGVDDTNGQFRATGNNVVNGHMTTTLTNDMPGLAALQHMIQEYHKNLKCLDAIGSSPSTAIDDSLDEVRASLLSGLAKLQSIHQQIQLQHQREAESLSPSPVLLHTQPIKSDHQFYNQSIKSQHQHHNQSIQHLPAKSDHFKSSQNEFVALMPVLSSPSFLHCPPDNRHHHSISLQQLFEENRRLIEDEGCSWFHGRLSYQG